MLKIIKMKKVMSECELHSIIDKRFSWFFVIAMVINLYGAARAYFGG